MSKTKIVWWWLQSVLNPVTWIDGLRWHGRKFVPWFLKHEMAHLRMNLRLYEIQMAAAKDWEILMGEVEDK